MDRSLKFLGWGLPILLSVFAYSQYRDLQQSRHDLLVEKRMGDLQAEIFAKNVEEFEQTIRDLRNRLSFARQDIAISREEIARLQDNLEEGTIAYANEPLNQERPLARLLNSPKVQELGSRMMVNARYGRFINNLNLNAEEEVQLNEIIGDVISRQNELRIQMATGEITVEDFQTEMANLSMEDALAGFLTPGEMDDFYTYQEEEDARMQQQAETAMKIQLTAQTPGLTEENRNTLAQILAQELGRSGSGGTFGGMMVANIRGGTGNSEDGDVIFQTQGISAQRQLNENILLQLEGTMDNEQLDIVVNYLEQQQMQVEMIQEIGEQQGFFRSR